MAGRKGQTFRDEKEKEKGWTLFNAGALGSELALVKSIFETLGTPNEEIWPVRNSLINLTYLSLLNFVIVKETANLPDWGKMTFVQFPGKTWEEILPGVEVEGRDLVERLVRYQSTERMRAEEVSQVLLTTATREDAC